MLIRRTVVVSIAIIASLFLAAEVAEAQIIESMMLFLSDRAGNPEVHVVLSDGKVKRLTRSANIDKDPAWSPDGKQIVWLSNKLRGGSAYDVWVMDADGNNKNPVVKEMGDGIREPQWSPDVTRIAFVAIAGAGWDIYFVDFTRHPEDKGKKEEPKEPLIYNVTGAGWAEREDADRDPQFSPDGTLLAFESNRDKNAEIYIADLAGEPGAEQGKVPGDKQQNLTKNKAQDRRPRWSPHGQNILFQSDRTGDWQIYSINKKGENLQQLTNDGLNWRAEWSPDGKEIVFESRRDKSPEIYIMNADGTEQVNLTNHPAHDTSPQWSPDGKKILFHSRRDGNQEVYVMDADGKNPVNMSNDPSKDWGARWQLSISYPVETTGKLLTTLGKIKQSALLQNYPNPFNPETWIPYKLSQDTQVTISIYNIKGQLVRTLSLGRKGEGTYLSKTKAAYWDGRDDAGEEVASGIYFYKFTAGDFIAKKMTALPTSFRKMVVAK